METPLSNSGNPPPKALQRAPLALSGLDFKLLKVFKAVVEAGIAGEPGAMLTAMTEMGYLPPQLAEGHQRAILDLADLAFGPLRTGGVYDFASRDLVPRRGAGITLYS